MRVDSIEWRPIRLGIRRLHKHCYAVSREGASRGIVMKDDGTWWARELSPRGVSGPNPLECGIGPMTHWIRGGARHSSFVSAAVSVSRVRIWGDSLQDQGMCRVFRTQVVGAWYTFLQDQHGTLYLFQDFPSSLKNPPSDLAQRALREVVRRAKLAFEKDD